MLPKSFLHHHPEFPELIRIVAQQESIDDPALVEKDYWIMHCLYGLQQLDMPFELKGGTSLSKGYGIIHRFSEDIDIRIEPPQELDVKTGRNQNKPTHVESRKQFYDWLVKTIQIDGIASVERDIEFDDEKYRSGGIRLSYNSTTNSIPDLKDGVLLEVGFDDITPGTPKDISSWAYDYAADKVEIIDNRAKDVLCYHPGYTLVEKLQAISTKYRKQQENNVFHKNFMRHYYDVYALLNIPEVQGFIGTAEYKKHKEKRFPRADNPIIAENEAFALSDITIREQYEKAYQETPRLYYRGQPHFFEILGRIHNWANRL